MKIEEHYKRLKESLQVIEECIKKGIVERQRTIGFSTSAACADMLEILLHKKNLIDPSFLIKHEWFKSKNKMEDKFTFEFPQKKEILFLVSKIEEKRNVLCYGKSQNAEFVNEVIDDFKKLKNKFKEVGVDEI